MGLENYKDFWGSKNVTSKLSELWQQERHVGKLKNLEDPLDMEKV